MDTALPFGIVVQRIDFYQLSISVESHAIDHYGLSQQP